MLVDLWSQVGILTGNSALTSYFKSSQEHISLSWFLIVTILFFDVVVPLIRNKLDFSFRFFVLFTKKYDVVLVHQSFFRQMWHVKSLLVKSKFMSVGFDVTSMCRRIRVRF